MNDSAEGFSAEERAAIKERAKELRAEAKRGAKREEGEAAVRATIAEMPKNDREIGEKLHAIISAAAPHLTPKLWYGQPAYTRDGEVVCFYQSASKFNTRYGTLGFGDAARLDNGNLWPSSFAITALSAADETMIADLIKRAAG